MRTCAAVHGGPVSVWPPGVFADTCPVRAGGRSIAIRTRAHLGRLKEVVASQHIGSCPSGNLPVPRSRLSTVHVSPTAERLGKPQARPRVRPPTICQCSRAGDRRPRRDPCDLPRAHRRGLCAPAGPGACDWAVAAADAALRRGLPSPERPARRQRVESARFGGAARADALPSLCSPWPRARARACCVCACIGWASTVVEQYSMPWVEGQSTGRLPRRGTPRRRVRRRGASTRSTAIRHERTGRRSCRRTTESSRPATACASTSTWSHLWDRGQPSADASSAHFARHRPARLRQTLPCRSSPPVGSEGLRTAAEGLCSA